MPSSAYLILVYINNRHFISVIMLSYTICFSDISCVFKVFINEYN